MVMILRTLLFPIDNGMGSGLNGDGYSAEYDVWTGKVTWRHATKETISKQQQLTFTLLMVSSVLSPLTVAGLLMLTRYFPILDIDLSSKIDRYAPIILGIVLFLAFEALMLAIRVRDPIAKEEPSLERQHDYFVNMFDFAIRKNIGGDRVKIPYLGTYLATTVTLLCVPLFYYEYLNPEALSNYTYGYLSILIPTSFLVSLIPNLLWNLILKHIIYIKLIRKTKELQNE
ncbi:membrane protein [Staphylococcus microti]|uniref:Membrane protein n=1 Tax=Staphylococcus microti TaxID=569857 RepID=A0A0D6XPF5_9STAP|nr:hypothetical protein [Staphylococcus microti]KIX90507.1 membrane protein [Staphylococcus microti]PNZ83413.1 hypothetical protein CD132_02620 [Staphylococcus microti]SUM57972.1 Uncharacterised protein [Staphylococcus microti]